MQPAAASFRRDDDEAGSALPKSEDELTARPTVHDAASS